MSEIPVGGTLRLLIQVICLAILSPPVHSQAGGGMNDINRFIPGTIPVKSQNWEISRDNVSGYVYFANSAGLIEYNGIKARIYPVPYRQGARSVYVNADGVIFTVIQFTRLVLNLVFLCFVVKYLARKSYK